MDILLTLQGLRDPALTAFFGALTFLGSEDAIFVLLAAIYWCVNRTLGLRLGLVFLGSQYLNEVLKDLVQEARPGPPIHPLLADTAPGAAWPSGHAQNTAAGLGTLAALRRRAWLWVLVVALVFLIGLSRLYLGVHWPIDVLSGWLIGALLAGAALGLVAAYPRLDARALAPWVVPAGLLGILGLVLLHATDFTTRAGGAALGLVAGWWLERRLVGFEPPAPLGRQVAKVVIGLAVALAIRVLLKPVLDALPIPGLPALLRYALLGLWVTWGAPAVFVRLFGRGTPVAAQVQERTDRA
ncbi:MAG TPA: phosphatase PAP2 family protein [Chloroflexia bacterium]|nr:phosphatase PAP2 family protein [Chloroflexia bacterium]